MHEQEYLRDAIGITILVSWYILSEMWAVTFLGFFNFVFSPLWRGCWQGPLNSRKRLNFRRWRGQIVIFLISSFSKPNLPSWLSIMENAALCAMLWFYCLRHQLSPAGGLHLGPNLLKEDSRLAHTAWNCLLQHKYHQTSKRYIW